MAPRSRERPSPRNRPTFNARAIVIYGIPFWVGAPIAGWYFDGWLGLKSAIIGLFLLGAYIGSTIAVAERSRRMSAKKTVTLAVIGFWARLIGLWLFVFLLSRAQELNLLVLLSTVAFGFTVMLAISIKDWLRD